MTICTQKIALIGLCLDAFPRPDNAAVAYAELFLIRITMVKHKGYNTAVVSAALTFTALISYYTVPSTSSVDGPCRPAVLPYQHTAWLSPACLSSKIGVIDGIRTRAYQVHSLAA